MLFVGLFTASRLEGKSTEWLLGIKKESIRHTKGDVYNLDI